MGDCSGAQVSAGTGRDFDVAGSCRKAMGQVSRPAAGRAAPYRLVVQTCEERRVVTLSE
jgi:hypothetical protein